jgi:hypothetical protein
MSVCRSCGRPIRWAKTSSGHNIPVDIERREGAGNIQLVDQGSYLAAIVGRAGSGPWVSHFVTCPQADAHRKERRR